jgi:FMN phosphatase YigB (HAD superfamily)
MINRITPWIAMEQAIFLDIGGTLVDFEPPFHYNIYSYLKSAGYNIGEKDVFRGMALQYGRAEDAYIGNGIPKLDYKDLLSYLGIDSGDGALIRGLGSLDILSNQYTLYDDALEFIKEVKNRGFKVVLVTNATKSIHRIITELDLGRYVDDVVASCDVGAVKPGRQIFEIARRRAGCGGIHIGDLYEVDYVGAKLAGLGAILLDRGDFYGELDVRKVGSLTAALGLIDGLEQGNLNGSPNGGHVKLKSD